MIDRKIKRNHNMALVISGFCVGASLAAFFYSLHQAMLPSSTTSWVAVTVFGALVAISAFLFLFVLLTANEP